MITLEQAKEDLANFLEKNPSMIPVQRDIDEHLNNAKNRLSAITFLLSDNLEQLNVELLMLRYELEKLAK